MVVKYCLLCCICLIVIAGELRAGVATELEVNDAFSARQALPVGTTGVGGSLASFNTATSDFAAVNTLAPGAVQYYSLTGLAGGNPFVAWTQSAGGALDSVLGTFSLANDPSSLIDLNDDGGPGGGFSSGLAGVVNADGTIHLGVTAWPDFGFVGNHSQQGDYDLFVQLDKIGFGDVDFFEFSGLLPGSPFSAEVTVGAFDSVLGVYDGNGTLLDFDDDGGVGALSRLVGLVPASGSLILSVSAFGDTSFIGEHSQSGDYELALNAAQAAIVPEPSMVVILGCICTGFTIARRPSRIKSRVEPSEFVTVS